jgi:hypothetical protein
MGFIIKNTSGLINTRLTDTGRQKLSQGNFNISYFQVGDSEVSYNTLPTSYNQFDTVVLEPAFNAQNSSGVPQSNKENVKYPYFVDGSAGNTYGIPFMDSIVSPVYNRAVMRGFFTGDTSATTINWSALTNNFYAINANYVVQMNTLSGTNEITLISNVSNPDFVREPAIGDIVTIYYDGKGIENCYCINLPTPTPTPTTSVTPSVTPSIDTTSTPTPTPSSTNSYPCDSPTPTPTPSKTPCLTPTPSRQCPLPPPPDCLVDMYSCYSMLTYKIVDICLGVITLDRPTPDFSTVTNECYGRVIVYPPNMTTIYDSITPNRHWNDNVINFESVCYTDEFDVKVWNMNIPWSENPAGLISSISKDYTNFGSVSYLGTKEYFGYASSSGQTDSSSVYYVNSFGDIVTVKPEQQKAIAIIHYTNQTVDFFYGEKFALEPYDPSNPADTTGEARNFKLHIPWLMWHKNPDCCNGQTFWVDPPGFDELDLFHVQNLQSTKNVDMNSPGIRYYHLWDTNPNLDGYPNRIGKVFPDDKLVIIDDEEIIAAMSYKSNRNWTLPSPKISLITPNTCGNDSTSVTGILTGKTEYMYVTYRLSNDNGFTNSLHCNYYSLIQGPNIDCSPITSQNVSVRFGGEFGCLSTDFPITTTTTTLPPCDCYEVTGEIDCTVEYTDCYGIPSTYILTDVTENICSITLPTSSCGTFSIVNLGLCSESVECGNSTTTTTTCPPFCDINQGFSATKFEIICQKVDGTGRPNSSEWKIIDFTDQLSATTVTVNEYITQSGLTGNTFVITQQAYDDAPTYNLNDYISLTPVGYTGTSLNFGDEYYFYGSLETDIQATIYEMRYKINLGQAEFQSTSNPTWTNGNPSYVTEIGLYDSNKNLMIISKMQSPILRQGIQQFLIKFDI